MFMSCGCDQFGKIATNGFEINAGRAFSIAAKAKTLSQIYNIFWNEK
ncbi:MAG: hypothetical protein LKG19_00610 [Saprospiraceae bacterium]|jgi:hypothetical protein|nr:hypothetical protein [Saprospiraceae bacterium]